MTLPNENRGVISRRALLEGAAAACAASIAAPFINRGRYRLFAQSAAEYSARAIALVQRSVVIDMLCPLTLNFPQATSGSRARRRSRTRISRTGGTPGSTSCIPPSDSAAPTRTRAD